jgi:hypothetical protein
MLAATFSLTSPTTLGVVTAVGTLLAGLAAVWVLLVAGPRYRLLYGPMKKQQSGDGSWTVQIYVSGRGRRDITRDAFDDNKPVVLDIGVPIRKLTGTDTSHRAMRTVSHCVEGKCLHIGPGLIGRRQDLRFDVIAEGKPKPPKCQASLIDVRVRRQRLVPLARAVAIFFAGGAVYVFAWLLAFFLVDLERLSIKPWHMLAGAAIYLTVGGTLMLRRAWHAP